MQFFQTPVSNTSLNNKTWPLNLQSLTIWTTSSSFTLEYNKRFLRVDRLSNYLSEPTQPDPSSSMHMFSSLLGILDLNGKKALVVCSQVKMAGCLFQRDVFSISKVSFLFFDPSHRTALSTEESDLLMSINQMLKEGIYFSFNYDLALPLSHTNAEHREKFNWGFKLQKQLLKVHPSWRLSYIQGYVGRVQLLLNGLAMAVVVISRRCTARAQTQLEARGVDQKGNAGNYIETEQIVFVNDQCYSFLQCRGSAPIYWGEKKSSYGFSTVNLQNSVLENQKVFQKHIKNISTMRNMQWVGLINLLSSSGQQQKIIQNYQCVVRRVLNNRINNNIINNNKNYNEFPHINYAYFDLSASKKNYHSLNAFIQIDLLNLINGCGCSTIKLIQSQKRLSILEHQKGILRTNCFDCIDRSNIFQSRVAAYKLIQILSGFNVVELKKGLQFLDQDSHFASVYRGLWADNGDALSKQHTGTGSTESFAQRSGKLSYLTVLDHGFKSLSRTILNFRQQNNSKNNAIAFLVEQKQTVKSEE